MQDDVAGKVINMLAGAMAELVVGDPMNYVTDVGPVIDDEAKQKLDTHKTRMATEGKRIFRMRPLCGNEARVPSLRPPLLSCHPLRRLRRKCSARYCMWCVMTARASTR